MCGAGRDSGAGREEEWGEPEEQAGVKGNQARPSIGVSILLTMCPRFTDSIQVICALHSYPPAHIRSNPNTKYCRKSLSLSQSTKQSWRFQVVPDIGDWLRFSDFF